MILCTYIKLSSQHIICTYTELCSKCLMHMHIPLIIFSIYNTNVLNCVLNSTLHAHKPVLSIQISLNKFLLNLRSIGKWCKARNLSETLDIHRNLNANETNYVLYPVTKNQDRIAIKILPYFQRLFG